MAKDWLDTLNDADVDLLYKYKTQGVDALTDAEVDRAYALQEQKAAWKPEKSLLTRIGDTLDPSGEIRRIPEKIGEWADSRQEAIQAEQTSRGNDPTGLKDLEARISGAQGAAQKLLRGIPDLLNATAYGVVSGKGEKEVEEQLQRITPPPVNEYEETINQVVNKGIQAMMPVMPLSHLSIPQTGPIPRRVKEVKETPQEAARRMQNEADGTVEPTTGKGPIPTKNQQSFFDEGQPLREDEKQARYERILKQQRDKQAGQRGFQGDLFEQTERDLSPVTDRPASSYGTSNVRNEATRGVELSLDPLGRLVRDDEGVQGATPEIIRGTDQGELASALQKVQEGRSFDLTPEERIALQKNPRSGSILLPENGTFPEPTAETPSVSRGLSDQQIAERQQMIADAAQPREEYAAWAKEAAERFNQQRSEQRVSAEQARLDNLHRRNAISSRLEDQAAARMADQARLNEAASRDASVEPYSQPSQASPLMEKIGGTRSGTIDLHSISPDVFLRYFPAWKRTAVRSDDGKPMVMYHGGPEAIKGEYRLPTNSNQLGIHVGDQEAANIMAARNPGRKVEGSGPTVHPVYVNIENPLYMPDMGWHAENIVNFLDGQGLTGSQRGILNNWKNHNPQWAEWGRVNDGQVRQLLQKMGYDGIIYKNSHEGSGTAAVVFDPKQIKSATALQLGKDAPKVNPRLSKLGVDEEILQSYESWRDQTHGNRSEASFEQLLNKLQEKGIPINPAIELLEKITKENGPEYLRVRPDVSAERNPLVGPGKKQAGVINLFGGKKPPSFEEFRKTLDKDISPEVARKVYDQYYGDIKTSTPQDKAVSRATGLPEVTSLKPMEEMVPRWKAEADIPGGAVDRLIRENIGSGGRMTAFKTGNSFVDWGVEHVLGTIREGQVKAKLAHSAIKSEVGALTSGFFRRKEAGEKVLAETMGEMLRVNGTKETPNIPAEGRKLYETLRKELDEVGTAVQEILGGTMRWSPNYLAAMFKGPYRSLVTMLDESGKPQIVGVIAGKTMADARAGVAAMRERFGPDANIPNPKLDTRFSTKNLRSSSDAISELLNHLKEAGPEAAEFQKALSEYYTASLKDYFGYTKHHKTKKGVEGADGNAPWRSQRENVYDLLQSQLDIIDSAHNWIAQQKVRKTMGELRELNVQKNAMRFLEKYTDHAFGNQTQLMRAVESAMDWTADALGINPTVMKEFSAQIRNTALVGVIGMSGAFLAQSLVQIPMALTGAILKNRKAGIHANPLLSITLGAHDGLAFALKKFDHLSADGEFFAKYFQKYGTVEPHIVEHEIPAQLIPTSGMTGVQKGVTQAANTAFKVWEKPTEMIGKYTIEAPERSTRATFAMTMAHYYRQAGYSLKEAAHLADKDTSIHFVDYSMEERSMAFGKLGEVGKFMGTVSTFKMNSLNQLVSFKNRKMYDVLAATGIAMWATGGLMGLPGFEDIESVAKWMKGKGWLNRTPTEHLLLNGNDLMTYGPLSMSPALAGLPPIALAQKFSLGNIAPDNALSFLYPLVSFYARNLEAAGKYAGTPTKENRNDMLRQMAPGNLKYAVDYFLKEKDDGLVVPQAGKHGAAGGYRRSPVENAYGMVAGVPSLQEAKDRQVVALTTLDAKARQELWSKTVDKAVALMVDGQPDRSKEQVQKLRELGADNEKIISALNEALKKKLVGTNTTFMEYAAIQARQGKPTVQKMRDKEMWQATRPK